MALYNTVPAEESTLLAPKKSNKIKGLVAGAALVAFALGAVLRLRRPFIHST